MLEAGYVHVGVGTPEEMYVWPYFARLPDRPADRAADSSSCFKLVYPGDYEDMKAYGTYLVLPRRARRRTGRWRYFLVGD